MWFGISWQPWQDGNNAERWCRDKVWWSKKLYNSQEEIMVERNRGAWALEKQATRTNVIKNLTYCI